MWAAFSSTSPDMKVTKAFLSKQERKTRRRTRRSKGRRKEIWRDVDRGNSEKDQKKGREKLCKGGHSSSSSKVRGGYDIEPYSIYPGRGGGGPAGERPEREFEVESVIGGDGFVVVSLRMVDTPGILTKDFWKGHK